MAPTEQSLVSSTRSEKLALWGSRRLPFAGKGWSDHEWEDCMDEKTLCSLGQTDRLGSHNVPSTPK